MNLPQTDESVPSRPPYEPAIAAYLEDVVRAYGTPGGPLSSLVLFGSAATGGYEAPVSDVDLLIVLRDDAGADVRARVRREVARLEAQHGLVKPRSRSTGPVGRALAAFAERVTANFQTFFVCTRADLLSGEPARILGIPRTQALFVDRVAVPSIVMSGVTVWGESLLDAVPLPPIRRLDVAKAFLGLFGQALFTAVWYPALPDATKYAMDTLKRSVHNCYFCHHALPAALVEEVAFLEARDGPSPILKCLLELRRAYRPAYAFVIGCLPALVRLHLRTARRARFPRAPRASIAGSYKVSPDDRQFVADLEAGRIEPRQFDHRAHIRAAYIYLAVNTPDAAATLMRDALLAFLHCHTIDPSRYHETVTRAWILAVRHFMVRTPAAESADAFIDANPRLLDSKIMLTHYSPGLLFSPEARATFVEPDLGPIPRHE